MADRDEKIFPALPQKRQRAREEGQIARSRDLTSAISFAAAILFLAGATRDRRTLSSRRVSRGDRRHRIARLVRSRWDARWCGRSGSHSSLSAVLVGAALAGAAAQGGLIFTFAKLAPDITRLNPISYFGRIFSSAGLVELAKSAVKIILIALVAWKTARWGLDLALGRARHFRRSCARSRSASRRILYICATIALVAAAGDYAHKRYEHETELRMTRQEFLDQLKQDEGNPLVKRAIRKAQRSAARQARRAESIRRRPPPWC